MPITCAIQIETAPLRTLSAGGISISVGSSSCSIHVWISHYEDTSHMYRNTHIIEISACVRDVEHIFKFTNCLSHRQHHPHSQRWKGNRREQRDGIGACVSAACVCEIIYSYSNFFLARLFFDTIFFFSRVAHIFACTGGVLAAHIRALRRLQTRHFSCCWKFMFIFSLHIIDILYVNHILLHFSSFVAFTCLRHLRATLSPSRKCKFEQKMGCMSYLFWVCLRRYTYKVREANRIFFFSLEFSRHVLQAKRFRVTTMCVGIMCAAWCTRNQG